MNNNPLISIIIPAYNYGHLIAETLLSVAEQSYINWECLIIDDGSTDNTTTVVTGFLEKHPELNFKYIKQSNSGTSAAKNKGVELANGELIQFLDADDLLSKDKLRIQTDNFKHTDTALVFSASQFFTMTAGGRVLQQKYPEGFLALETLSGERLLSRLITNNIITISSPLVKTELIRKAGGFDVSMGNNEDWIFWVRIALIKPYFVFDCNSKSVVFIRIHGESAMNKHQQMFLGEVRVREQIDGLLRNDKYYAERLLLVKLNADLLALHKVRSLDFGKGMSYIMSSFVRNPLSEYQLLYRGVIKMITRIYKSVIHK